MIVAVPRETYPGERRVALVPASVPALSKVGMQVVVEAGAGSEAGYPDALYQEKGARIVGDRKELTAADIVLQVRTAGANRHSGCNGSAAYGRGQVVIALADPLGCPQAVSEMAARGVSLLALELLPRISRAQSMDVLSSQATIAGYRAVLLAATHLPKLFPMLIAAAGTLNAAKVLVVGAGVAGLQAIATARRLGAAVSAYDVRPAVKEQVQSLGAKFVEMPLSTAGAETKGGYAGELGEEFYRRQRELMARVVAESDVVITTAAIPGKQAPILVTAEMVARMAPGSVIVDLAAERGGNCESTEPGRTVVKDGVHILGPLNVASDIPQHASLMYSKNIVTFLLNLLKDNQINLNLGDEIIRETLLTRDGQVVHPKVCKMLSRPGL